MFAKVNGETPSQCFPIFANKRIHRGKHKGNTMFDYNIPSIGEKPLISISSNNNDALRHAHHVLMTSFNVKPVCDFDIDASDEDADLIIEVQIYDASEVTLADIGNIETALEHIMDCPNCQAVVNNADADPFEIPEEQREELGDVVNLFDGMINEGEVKDAPEAPTERATELGTFMGKPEFAEETMKRFDEAKTPDEARAVADELLKEGKIVSVPHELREVLEATSNDFMSRDFKHPSGK